MFKLLVIMFFVQYLSAYMVEVHEFEEDEELLEKHRTGALQTRCTRRFSPGACMEDVRPVWTYNFHLQNCTERLGCRQRAVTNRFLSYRRCMVSCQSLVQIYNHILSQSELDADDQLTRQPSLLRRSQELEAKNIPTEEPSSEEDYAAENSDPYVENQPGPEDPEKIALAEILPPDIDRRTPDFSPFDPLHGPRQF